MQKKGKKKRKRVFNKEKDRASNGEKGRLKQEKRTDERKRFPLKI